MSRTSRFLTLSLLVCSLIGAQAQKPSWEYPALKMPAWHAQAVAVALRDFQKNQGGKTDRGEPVYGDLRHYSVRVSQSPPDQLPLKYERDECIRVNFVPDLSKRDHQTASLGGRTSFGIEVSYDISRSTMKIVKTSFER